MQALAGIVLAAVMFGGAFVAVRKQRAVTRLLWWRIAALAFLPAVLFGWTLETHPDRELHARRLAALARVRGGRRGRAGRVRHGLRDAPAVAGDCRDLLGGAGRARAMR